MKKILFILLVSSLSAIADVEYIKLERTSATGANPIYILPEGKKATLCALSGGWKEGGVYIMVKFGDLGFHHFNFTSDNEDFYEWNIASSEAYITESGDIYYLSE